MRGHVEVWGRFRPELIENCMFCIDWARKVGSFKWFQSTMSTSGGREGANVVGPFSGFPEPGLFRCQELLLGRLADSRGFCMAIQLQNDRKAFENR